MHTRAKALKKAHPAMSYQNALKKAGAELRSGKIKAKVSGHKRKAAPRKKKHAAPRKRKRVGAVYAVEHTLERVGATISQTRGHLRRQLESELKGDLYRREVAANKTERKKASKAIAETKRELRAVGGLKHKRRK